MSEAKQVFLTLNLSAQRQSVDGVEAINSFKGPKGDKGDKGDTGAQGPKGDKGAKGDPGAAFTYSDFTEEQLAGLVGPKGDKGDKGDTGPQGPKGDTGQAGPKGDTGDIGNLTINGKAPDAAGAVTLGAEDVGALATGATAANSAKLGGKAPEYYLQPRNLLDNSYWEKISEIVNQRGETRKQDDWVYWIDRWQVNAAHAAISLVDGGIHIPAQIDKNMRLVQRVPLERIQKGRAYTIAVCESDGTVRCASGIYNGQITGDGNGDNLIYVALHDGDGSTFYYFIIDCYKDAVLRWAAIYEGAYTADTLPPYVPKGYAAELSECQMYLRPFVNAISGRANELHAIMVEMPLSPPMRKDGLMTVTFNNGEAMYSTAYTVDGAKQVVTSFQSECNEHVARYVFYCADELSVGTPNVLTGLNGWISKEL